MTLNSLKKIDCLTFGFPCNDFSLVGKHKGFEGEFGPLYTYGIKVLNKFISIYVFPSLLVIKANLSSN